MVKNSPMLRRIDLRVIPATYCKGTNEDIVQQLRKLANENGTTDQEEAKEETTELLQTPEVVQKSQEKTPKNNSTSLEDLDEPTIPSEDYSSITTCTNSLKNLIYYYRPYQ